MNKFYVYAYVIDNVVRYIGKGSGYRAAQHMAIVRRIARQRASGQKVKAEYFHNKLCKEWKRGAVIQSVKIAAGLSEPEAYARERLEINAAPKGQLWNRWVGGLGSFTASPELRQQLSEAAKARYRDDGQLAQARAHMAALAASKEVRAKRSATQALRFAAGEMKSFHEGAHTRETFEKRGKTLKRTLADRPDLRNRVAQWRKSHMAEHTAALKAAHARPDIKAKRRIYYDSADGRAKLRAAAQARWAKHRADQLVSP